MRKRLCLAALLIVLAACASGGSGPAPGAPATTRNRQPVVVVRCRPCLMEPGSSTMLFADAKDPDGDVLTYQWSSDFGAGQLVAPTSRQCQWHAPQVEGRFRFTVTVTDGRGGVATATTFVDVIQGSDAGGFGTLLTALSASDRQGGQGTGLDPKAAEVLTAAREALGGESRLAAIRSLQISGWLGEKGCAGRLAVALELPGTFVQRAWLSLLDTEYGGCATPHVDPKRPVTHQGLVSGVGFWVLPESSRGLQAREAITDSRITATQRHLAVSYLLPLFAASWASYPMTFSYAGRETLAGRSADVIQGRGLDGFVFRLFVDATTHLPSGLAWSNLQPSWAAFGTPVEHQMTIRNYKLKDGVNWPREFKVTVGKQVLVDAWSLVYSTNAAADPDTFIVPKPPGQADRFWFEVVQRLEQDRMLPPAEREAALARARREKDDPHDLAVASWEIVKAPGRRVEDYEIARRRAEVSLARRRDGTSITALAFAQYRLGQFQACIDGLPLTSRSPVQQVIAVSMARFRLGEVMEAKRVLDTLRAPSRSFWLRCCGVEPLFAEATVLIEGRR